MVHELCAFPIGHAGLQPELLADAVQPRGASPNRGLEAYYVGDRAPAVSVSGREDCAARRRRDGALQRPLCRGGNPDAAHEPTTFDRVRRALCAGSANAAADLTGVHRILCTNRVGIGMSYRREVRT